MVDSFSYSMLSTAQRCNTLFKYKFIDKLVSAEPDSGDMKFGTAIHLGVQGILEGGKGLEDFHLFWDLERSKGNAYGRYKWDELRDMGEKLLVRFERLHAKKYAISQMEQRLYMEHKGTKFEGTPDFIGTYEGVMSLVDFKTSGYRYDKRRVGISDQLHLYAYLAEAHGFTINQLMYVVFVKGTTPSIQVITAPYSSQTALDIMSNLCAIQETLGVKQWTKNRANCIVGEKACEYFKNCYPETKEITHE